MSNEKLRRISKRGKLFKVKRICYLLASNGPQISDTESTNVMAVLKAQIRSVDENGNVSHCHCKRFTIAECERRTPFGTPVLPDVYKTKAKLLSLDERNV